MAPLVPFGSRKSGPSPRIPRKGRMPNKSGGTPEQGGKTEATGNPRKGPSVPSKAPMDPRDEGFGGHAFNGPVGRTRG